MHWSIYTYVQSQMIVYLDVIPSTYILIFNRTYPLSNTIQYHNFTTKYMHEVIENVRVIVYLATINGFSRTIYVHFSHFSEALLQIFKSFIITSDCASSWYFILDRITKQIASQFSRFSYQFSFDII